MDFDLELLKQGIKGRYQIVGCTKHPWQQALKKMEMEEEFYGHIIEIEDSKNAVWFKLNYDNIGRGVTKYIGGWRDLDPEHIAPQILLYQGFAEQLRKIKTTSSGINHQFYYLNSFVEPRQPHPPLMDKAHEAAKEYHRELKAVVRKIQAETRHVEHKMTELQDQVRKYIADHKG